MEISRLAIISDVHANLEALKAVLADIRDCGVKYAIFLGDVVGYGASPLQCLDVIRENTWFSLLGNHDVMVATSFPLRQLRPDVRAPLLYARRQLGRERRDYLGELMLNTWVGNVEVTHACLCDPYSFHYLHDNSAAARHFQGQEANVCFYGHTHLPHVWSMNGDSEISGRHGSGIVRLQRNRKYAIGVGAVGQPRDGDPRACYVIYDFDLAIVEYRRVEYNIEEARRKIHEAGLPPYCGDRLIEGV